MIISLIEVLFPNIVCIEVFKVDYFAYGLAIPHQTGPSNSSARVVRDMGDIVGIWEVNLSDGLHRIEFEHGTTSGKRVVRIDGKEIIKRDWMFRLVGVECFSIGKAKCSIKIEPIGGFSYEYCLEINGKSYKKFTDNQNKIMKCWCFTVDEQNYRVTLEKDSMDVWVNGDVVETTGEFVDDGTETHFEINGRPAYIKVVSSGNKREGLIHSLIINETEIPESFE